MLIPHFPNATNQDSFSHDEIKSLFYHAMLVRWRTNFINSGLNFASSSIEILRTYMVQQELQTDAHCKKNREGNKRSNNNQKVKSSSTTYSFSNNSKSTKKKNNSNQQGSNDKKQKRLANDDDCPIHGGSHKWGQCHQNQYGGENFRPRQQSAASSTASTFLNQRQGNNTLSRHPPQIQVYHNDWDSLSQDTPSQATQGERSYRSSS